METADRKRRSDRYHFETLQVVFKIVERCNINCSYCYYFNAEDQTALDRPAVVDNLGVATIADYLASGIKDLGIKRVIVSFHGGEPMLLKPKNFDAICKAFREKIGAYARLGFTIQTNGTILNEKWEQLFEQHEVDVGVSIDGTRQANDRFRLDHKGKSTFDKIERNLNRLIELAKAKEGTLPSTISVIDARNDYHEMYAFLRATGVKSMNFLLPDRSVDSGFESFETAEGYGTALAALTNAWFDEDDPNIQIRQVKHVLNYFQEAQSPAKDTPESDKILRAFKIIIIQSDGNVAPNDSYMPAASWYKYLPKLSVFNSTLRDFIDLPIFEQIDKIEMTLPAKCQACKWRGICKGGDIENRFSQTNGFDNPSIYCGGLQVFYSSIMSRLIQAGYPEERIEAKLIKLNDQLVPA